VTAPFRPREIFATLEDRRVDYVTVGGFALIAHGVVRATLDVDVIPARDHANLERLLQALADLAAIPAGEPHTQVDLDLLERDANMRFDTAAGQLDLLLAHHWDERYEQLRATAVRATAAGIKITIVGRQELIRMKTATGRDRDLMDIGDLLAIDPDAMPETDG
jgi:hypothetical protein